MRKRIIIGLIMGSILGVFCIIGAQVRSGFTQSNNYLFAFWYNRVLMGLVIGLFPFTTNLKLLLVRGAFLGGFVSLAFYSATGFSDLMGLLAGIIYGVIIEIALYKLNRAS